jgi:membrane protease YdiL (CAAX protease family)
LKLRKNKLKGIAWGTSVGLIIVAGNLIATFVLSGHWRFNPDIGLNRWIGPVLLVGFSEDLVFRGFFLQEFARRTTFFKANLLQAFLFLLIHFPGWILLNQFQFPGIFQRIVTLMVFALVAGWVLRKSNSLWACMLIHSFNNFSSFAISNF